MSKLENSLLIYISVLRNILHKNDTFNIVLYILVNAHIFTWHYNEGNYELLSID